MLTDIHINLVNKFRNKILPWTIINVLIAGVCSIDMTFNQSNRNKMLEHLSIMEYKGQR